jgi:hypothetical protein
MDLDYIESFQIHPVFVKNITLSVTKSLINLQIEFIFGKLYKILRVYEECFKYFHRSLVAFGIPIKDLKLSLNEVLKFL